MIKHALAHKFVVLSAIAASETKEQETYKSNSHYLIIDWLGTGSLVGRKEFGLRRAALAGRVADR